MRDRKARQALMEEMEAVVHLIHNVMIIMAAQQMSVIPELVLTTQSLIVVHPIHNVLPYHTVRIAHYLIVFQILVVIVVELVIIMMGVVQLDVLI